MPLNNTADQTFHEVLWSLTDCRCKWIGKKREEGNHREKKSAPLFSLSNEKGRWLSKEKSGFISEALWEMILFVLDEAWFSSFEDCEERQSFSPPSHLKMTTFHLYIVFRLWFWLSLAFGTVTWHGFWQLPAERNKPSTLSTFKWSLSHCWGVLMYANEVGVYVCVHRLAWDRLGGWRWKREEEWG